MLIVYPVSNIPSRRIRQCLTLLTHERKEKKETSEEKKKTASLHTISCITITKVWLAEAMVLCVVRGAVHEKVTKTGTG